MAPFWDPPDLKKHGFRVEGVAFFEKSRGSEKHPKNGNLAIMEREAREVRERTSIASKARAARAAKTARGRAAGSPRGAKARVARAAPESRQQARTIAYSLARALRALAGGLSWERLGRIALLGNALEILPKSLPEASREDHQEKRLDSDGKHEERSTKNGEKNQSKAPGGTTKPTWRERREHQDCECGGSPGVWSWNVS